LCQWLYTEEACKKRERVEASFQRKEDFDMFKTVIGQKKIRGRVFIKLFVY